MNWLDFVFIAVFIVGALFGMKTGLIGAAFIAAGAIIGWMLAGQWSDDIGGMFADSVSNDTLVTVVSYAVIIIGSLFAASIVGRILRKVLSILTFGLTSVVDKLGGLALGLLIGAALSGAIIIGSARLTYNFDVEHQLSMLDQNIAGQVLSRRSEVEDVKVTLENALTESKFVPIFIDLTDALPADAMGLIPSDFKVALDILEETLDLKKAVE